MAEAIVLELIEKCFESEKDELKKIKKKRKLTTDCDNPTTKKESIYKKQKLDNLQDQKAATPQKPQTPINKFLEGFKFKNKINKQETTTHQKHQKPPTPLPQEKKNEKEIFMSKFARMKNKFEKEKVKTLKGCNKLENVKKKLSSTPKSDKKQPCTTNHHQTYHKSTPNNPPESEPYPTK